MAYVNDTALDASLTNIKTSDRLYLCSAEPTTYATAVSLALVQKDSPTLGAIGDYAGGRQFTVSAITDASGIADGTATHWALVNIAGTLLIATQSLSSPFAVLNGDTVEIDAFNIQSPDVA